jgi:hypothetical protein
LNNEEAKTLASILLALGSRQDVMAWRNNVLNALDTKTGRRIRSCPDGVGDVVGVLDGGRGFAIECKSSDGRLRPAQKAFRARWESLGGLYVLARTQADAINAVNEALGCR